MTANVADTAGHLVPLPRAAPQLGMSEPTLRRLCAKGEVGAAKIGGRWYVKAAYITHVAAWEAEPS